MPRHEATRVLLAARADVWGFLAEPRHLADWWPGIAAVEPDRRGLAPGARWQVRRGDRPGWLRRARAGGTLVVLEVEPYERVTWQFVQERIDVELRLHAESPARTRATLAVTGPFLVALGRQLPQRALGRLHALCQTAAEL